MTRLLLIKNLEDSIFSAIVLHSHSSGLSLRVPKFYPSHSHLGAFSSGTIGCEAGFQGGWFMYRRSVCWATVLAVLLVCALTLTMLPAASAQETNAGVQGYVKDQSGAVMAGVVLEISTQSMIGVKQNTTHTTRLYRVP